MGQPRNLNTGMGEQGYEKTVDGYRRLEIPSGIDERKMVVQDTVGAVTSSSPIHNNRLNPMPSVPHIAPPLIVWPILVAIQLIFAGWHVLGKIALDNGVSPLCFALYREIIASICMWILCLYIDGAVKMQRRDIPRFFLMGVCSFINVVGSVVALDMVSAANVSLLQPSIPVFAVGVALAMRVEAFTKWKAFGVVLAVAGAVLVVVLTMENQGHSSQLVLGNVILIVQCMSVALLIVLQKTVITRYPYFSITAWYYSIGTLFTAVAAGASLHSPDDLKETNTEVWIALVYAALLATVFNYCAMTWANKHVDPSVVSAFMTLQPVGTVILSIIFLSYLVNLAQLGAGCIVIAGLLVTSYGQIMERRRRLRQAINQGSASEILEQEQYLSRSRLLSDANIECNPAGDEA
ncbi:hypothetical protein AAMO2058_000742200 [Amorphochlora amoebiformis]